MSENEDLVFNWVSPSNIPRFLVAFMACDGGEAVDGFWGDIA